MRDYPAEFVKSLIKDKELTIKKREAMEEVWGSGTDASWRHVGCFKSKSERLKDSAMHGRIASKNRHELKMLKSVLERLKQSHPLT